MNDTGTGKTTLTKPEKAAKDMVKLMVEDEEEWAVTQSQDLGWIVMVHLHLVKMGWRSVMDPYENMVCIINNGCDLPDHLKDLMDEYERLTEDRYGDDTES